MVPNSLLPSATKQRFIDGLRMLLDIANESASALPPLKSCLGGICAIIKHCEVRLCWIVALALLTDSLQESQGVTGNLEDLILWVATLKDNLTNASGDPEEAERREKLKQFVLHLDYLPL